MELRHLRYFVAVAEDLNVTRAAERLHMAQQPLSAAIKNLEVDLGFDLFERVANRLHLTAAGVAFLGQARSLLSAAEDAVECGRRVARGESGVLRIGYCSAAMGRVLPAAIASFRERFPAIALRLRRLDQGVQLAALERDDLDLAFVYRPFDERGRSSSDVLEERLMLLVPRAHELADREAIGIDQLVGLPLIRFSSDATRPWRLATDQVLADAAFKPEYVDDVADAETGIGLVAAGMGATILTEHAARDSQQSGVAAVPLLTDFRVRLAAVWNERAEAHLLRRRFLNLLSADDTLAMSQPHASGVGQMLSGAATF